MLSITQPSAVARCNAFHVLGRAFDLPRRTDQSCPPLLREAFAPLGPRLDDAGERAAQTWQAAMEDLEALAVAYARLFLGPFEILAPPYASLYLDPEKRLMGPVSFEVGQCYAQAGLTKGPGPNEPPDHVSHELEFMYFLAFRALTSEDPVWEQRQRRFWSEQLRGWLPNFARDIRQANCHPFYSALAELVTLFCQHVDAIHAT